MRAILLAGLMLLGACTAAAAQDTARIEQAYAKKVEAQRNQDVEKRIAGRQQALENAPASPFIGNSSADVVIVEFFDYNCPYCKAIEPRLEALLKADRKVKLVLKEFPILTPASMTGTRAALASVKQGKYQTFHEAMMNFRGQLQDADVFDMAKAAGLDMTRLRKDMTAPEVSDEIIANFNLARGIRVFQTPAFIVGGHLMDSDSASIDFAKAVAAARRK